MIIRSATRDDFTGVLASLRELNQEHVKCFTRKYVKHLIKTHCVNIAEENGQILGACVLKMRNPETLEVFALGVAQKRRKVGSELLSLAKNTAKSLDCRFIVADSWKFYDAKEFYRKNGFGWFVASFGYTFFIRLR